MPMEAWIGAGAAGSAVLALVGLVIGHKVARVDPVEQAIEGWSTPWAIVVTVARRGWHG